ncbi:hypothetical protein Tco_0185793 [Tanacetum coccineum]
MTPRSDNCTREKHHICVRVLGYKGVSSDEAKLIQIFKKFEAFLPSTRSPQNAKKPEYQEISSGSDDEEDSEDAYEDLNSPYKRPKPTHFTPRITRFKYHRRAKLPRNIKVYEGNKDPDDHLSIFLAAAEQEEWPMPIWCKMFRQTLGGAARNWFDDLDPKSMDSFEEPSQKFLEEFSQQKRYAASREGQVKVCKFSWIGSKLAKKLNDKIPKMVDEMFKRVRAFIREEVAASSVEMVRSPQWDKGNTRPVWSGGQEKARNRSGPMELQRNMGMYTPYSRRDTFTPLTKTPKEILAIESINSEEANRISRSLRKVGSSSKRYPSEQSQKWKPVKERCESDKHDKWWKKSQETIRNRKIRFNKGTHLPSNSSEPLDRRTNHIERNDRRSLGEVFHPLGLVDLRVTMGRAGRNKHVLMEFAIVKCHSPYNVIMGRIGMRGLGAVGSTIHSMIKFPTDQGVVIMETSKEALWECSKQYYGQGTTPSIGLAKNQFYPKKKETKKTWEKKITICSKRPDQCITIRSTLSICCKQHLTNVLRKHVDVFAWIGSEGTMVLQFVMEHQLKTYPLGEPVAYRKRPLTPDRRQALKEKVFNWLKEGIIRRVQHPEWVTNAAHGQSRSLCRHSLIGS